MTFERIEALEGMIASHKDRHGKMPKAMALHPDDVRGLARELRTLYPEMGDLAEITRGLRADEASVEGVRMLIRPTANRLVP